MNNKTNTPDDSAPRTNDIVTRLRNYNECNDGDVDEAADILEFFFGQMQMRDPSMDGLHIYRFRNGGWPMTHCKGPNSEDAVRAAVQEMKRSTTPTRVRLFRR